MTHTYTHITIFNDAFNWNSKAMMTTSAVNSRKNKKKQIKYEEIRHFGSERPKHNNNYIL